MPKFNAGDRVILKHEEYPKMTVEGYTPDALGSPSQNVRAIWWDSGKSKFRTQTIHEDALELASEDGDGY